MEYSSQFKWILEVDLKTMNSNTSQYVQKILRQFNSIYKLTFKNEEAYLDPETINTLLSGIKAAPNLESITLPSWCAKDREFYMGTLAEQCNELNKLGIIKKFEIISLKITVESY